MRFPNAVACSGFLLVFSFGTLAHAHDYTADLSTLAGLSGEEVKQRLTADPLLLTKFLDAAHVDSVLPNPGLAGSSLLSESNTCTGVCPQKSEISITDVPFKKYPAPPGSEFLGVGYNIFTANPRGSLTSGLDPGKTFLCLVMFSHGYTSY